ncbi:MAG: lipopolysaccharide biosynthesis protein [Planctomycetes bacterium]|nr:lipopolysaccharide biosynthesis protein [Planctomycetota bacterium]
MQERPTFRHAVKWAFVMTTGQYGIAILLMFVLAAVLGPSEFGLIAMAGAYIIFVEMFVAQGMGAAIIQRKDLKDEHLDSIFWLILVASVLLAIISVAISPWWATVNDLPRLASVISVLSLSIPIKGLTVVQYALLQRKMDFRNLALLSGAASIIGGVIGVAMALSGYGVWSLVAQQLVSSALATLIMWKVSSWRPRFRFSYRRARELFGFSGGMLASQLGVYTARQSDVILMGVFFGPIAVGLYRLADRIMDMILDFGTRSIQVVSLPHFSSLQDDPPKLRASLLSCIRLSTAITIPGMTILAVSSDQLMVLIDAKWAPAASVIQIVVFMGMAKSVTLFCGPVLLAHGRSKTVAALVWTLAILTAGLIAIVSMSLVTADVMQQITAVAIARTGLFVVIFGTSTFVVFNRMCKISMRQLGAAIRPGVAAACVVFLMGKIISSSAIPTSEGSFVALLWITIPTAVAAGITLVATDKEIRQLLLDALRRLRLGQWRTNHGMVAVRDD